MQKRIIILGGGTAGWIMAARLAAEGLSINGEPTSITLIESSDVPTIGVGEGTWPSMRSTLERIGIPEKEFLSTCHAAFKQGSRFVDWCQGKGESYDHPFTMPAGMGRFALGKAWRQQQPSCSFSHWTCLQSDILDARRAPKQLQTPDYAGVFNYGYHLDAGRFAELLKKHAVDRLGVNHCIGHFASAEQDGNGWITALLLSDGRRVEADFFIDASGTHNKLIGGVLPVEFVSLKDVSPNDRALAMPVNYPDPDAAIESATLSIAREAGWIWNIGLQHRRGIGYVYSSAFASDDEALRTLSRYATGLNKDADASVARKLTINPGYRATPWVNNCVAVGMSAGFIEPLEASALVMVELAATWLCEHLPTSTAAMPGMAQRYNQLFAERWSRIRDFLQLHYKLSQRRDTAYWQTVTEEIPLSDKLTALLEEWKYRDPVLNDFGHYMELFPSASYLYILLGMRPDYPQNTTARVSDNPVALQRELAEQARKLAHYLAHLPANRDYLKTINRQPVMA